MTYRQESFDEACRFDVVFRGVIGSDAHRAHHETLMAKLAARAHVIEAAAAKAKAAAPRTAARPKRTIRPSYTTIMESILNYDYRSRERAIAAIDAAQRAGYIDSSDAKRLKQVASDVLQNA